MSESPTPKPTKRLIKEAIKSLLLNKTEAQSRVEISQSTPSEEEDLPKIIIYSVSEDVSRFNQGSKEYKRVMSLVIECIAQGNTDDELDEHLEVMGEAVERQMEIDETLNGLTDRLEFRGTTYVFSDEGSAMTASIALSYDVVFYEYAIKAGSIVYPPLEGADVGWDLNTEDEELNAEDTYNFEQGEET